MHVKFLQSKFLPGNDVQEFNIVEETDIPIADNVLLNPMFGGKQQTKFECKLDGKYFVTIRDRDWYWNSFLSTKANRDHRAYNPFSPHGHRLNGIQFPKSLVVVAGLDLLQDYYTEELRRAGKEKGKTHALGASTMVENKRLELLVQDLSQLPDESVTPLPKNKLHGGVRIHLLEGKALR